MTLPKDITRCHDTKCSQRDDCQRFVFRDSGYLHSATLRTGAPIYCESKIPVEVSAPMTATCKDGLQVADEAPASKQNTLD